MTAVILHQQILNKTTSCCYIETKGHAGKLFTEVGRLRLSWHTLCNG